MSNVKINIKYIDPYSSGSDSDSSLNNSLSSLSTDSDYIPSQTADSESYTSYESSVLPTPTESEYSTLTDSEYSLSSLE